MVFTGPHQQLPTCISVSHLHGCLLTNPVTPGGRGKSRRSRDSCRQLKSKARDQTPQVVLGCYFFFFLLWRQCLVVGDPIPLFKRVQSPDALFISPNALLPLPSCDPCAEQALSTLAYADPQFAVHSPMRTDSLCMEGQETDLRSGPIAGGHWTCGYQGAERRAHNRQ
jgi:hypothetical protein